ncbi:hypothetical protein KFL_000700110 [Klebsormidium nitens]|uniref:Uncharacterized protein n=1 Tax=Klebsormidium nitens TaxID=105231 RepID=A0A1Y1HR08_KLENI|nr:hypothetical protein KFL_000700110 [Klebsormidium nitens]|eukprot:GAQ81075.1 hypothetical protein KFL_000700110 [Klebsormidium nitens]
MHNKMDCDIAAETATGMQGARTRNGALFLVALLVEPVSSTLRGSPDKRGRTSGGLGASWRFGSPRRTLQILCHRLPCSWHELYR